MQHPPSEGRRDVFDEPANVALNWVDGEGEGYDYTGESYRYLSSRGHRPIRMDAAAAGLDEFRLFVRVTEGAVCRRCSNCSGRKKDDLFRRHEP